MRRHTNQKEKPMTPRKNQDIKSWPVSQPRRTAKSWLLFAVLFSAYILSTGF